MGSEMCIRDRRQTKRVRRPLFPGYLFVNLDLESTGWWTINGTIGVQHIVSFGKKPSAINDGFVSALKSAEDIDGLIKPTEDVLEPGQSVEIVRGPLSGKIVRLLRMDPGNRVSVLLETLGHSIKGQIDREAIVGV